MDVELKVTPDKYLPYRYAGASGDYNPIHLDPEFAKQVGLPSNILHGLYSMAQVARACTQAAGGDPRPTLESDSMILLFSHVRTGRWASVMPAKLAETLGLTDTLRAIPIIKPEAVQTIGLVVPKREPNTPLTAALIAEAKRIAPALDS